MSESLKLSNFRSGEQDIPVRFIETQLVKEGVSCDVYAFVDDPGRDLGVVTVRKGYKTPRQRVLQDVMTIEGFLGGRGSLRIQGLDGTTRTYVFPAEGLSEVTVAVGEIMQWQASGEAELVFYEICEPPYTDGRFENMSDD